MKLYGTITSERASKGQGGNKNIRIVLNIEHDNKEREQMGDLFLERNDDYDGKGNAGYVLTYAAGRSGECARVDTLAIKGEKQ